MSYRMIETARRLMRDKFSVLCNLAELNAKQVRKDQLKEDEMMSDKLNEIKSYIEKELAILEAEAEEINEWLGDDFNPCDASGGNFDDAYYLGDEHGDTFGRISVLKAVRAIIEKECE